MPTASANPVIPKCVFELDHTEQEYDKKLQNTAFMPAISANCAFCLKPQTSLPLPLVLQETWRLGTGSVGAGCVRTGWF